MPSTEARGAGGANNKRTIEPENKDTGVSTTTGNLEVRKLWSVPKAEYIYALFVEVKTEGGAHEGLSWQCPQGYVGDEEWAKATAEHFHLTFPTEEYREPAESTKEA